MKAYLFSGQGSQFVGMGKSWYQESNLAKKIFNIANEILGFPITSIMFNGPDYILKKTKNTQLAIYIYSLVEKNLLYHNFNPDMVAGNSLGEFSALTSIGVLSFEDGLLLINKRASMMQKICDTIHSKMAVIFGLEDSIIEKICQKEKGIVVPSNYNAPNQLVISGEYHPVMNVCKILKKIGAKKIIFLPVHGGFHSPIMKPIEEKLNQAINQICFKPPKCPIYQNFSGKPIMDIKKIKENLIKQLINPVMWKQSIQNMIINGARSFIEIGPGKILKKIAIKIMDNLEKKM